MAIIERAQRLFSSALAALRSRIDTGGHVHGQSRYVVPIALLSVPLLAASQSLSWGSALALIALVPLLGACAVLRVIPAALAGTIVGTAYGMLVATWIPDALQELGSTPLTSWLGLLVTAAWAKLGIFAVLGSVASLARRSPPVLQLTVMAAATFGAEWIVSTWRLGVPVALIGHSQIGTLGTAQVASLGGVPLVSAWIVAINQAIVAGLRAASNGRRVAFAAMATWIALALLGLPLSHISGPRNRDGSAADATVGPAPDQAISILLVQPAIRHRDRWVPELQAAHLRSIAAFTARALGAEPATPDFVLWPENVVTQPVDGLVGLDASLESAVRELGVPVITGVARSARGNRPGEYRSAVLSLDPLAGQTAVLDKARAIPVLESGTRVPALGWIGRLFGRASRWPKVQEVPAQEATVSDPGFSGIVPTLCYEILFPGIVADRRSPDSLAIANLADDSWVAGDAATRLLERAARFRAIEQRLPLVRVAHGGLSTAIDPFGAVVSELPMDRWASGLVHIHPTPAQSGLEKVALLSLPTTAAAIVWWAPWAWTRRRAFSPVTPDATDTRAASGRFPAPLGE